MRIKEIEFKKNIKIIRILMDADYINVVTINEVKRIFNFCNLNMTYQKNDFIKDSNSSKNKNIYSVYRKKLMITVRSVI